MLGSDGALGPVEIAFIGTRFLSTATITKTTSMGEITAKQRVAFVGLVCLVATRTTCMPSAGAWFLAAAAVVFTSVVAAV